MSTKECQCVTEAETINLWTIHYSQRNALLAKFKRTTLKNGFVIPSGFNMWFKPGDFIDNTPSSGTASKSHQILFKPEALNQLIRDINIKKLKGIEI